MRRESSQRDLQIFDSTEKKQEAAMGMFWAKILVSLGSIYTLGSTDTQGSLGSIDTLGSTDRQGSFG